MVMAASPASSCRARPRGADFTWWGWWLRLDPARRSLVHTNEWGPLVSTIDRNVGLNRLASRSLPRACSNPSSGADITWVDVEKIEKLFLTWA